MESALKKGLATFLFPFVPGGIPCSLAALPPTSFPASAGLIGNSLSLSLYIYIYVFIYIYIYIYIQVERIRKALIHIHDAVTSY